MTNVAPTIPVVLLAYARPAHLRRVLACLRTEQVPLIYAFADAPRGAVDAGNVAEVRGLLRGIDWCEVRLTERAGNLGLGRNVLTAVTEVAQRHEAFVVWEDDLVCMPGTYLWLCSALQWYAADARVFSVSAWTHPLIKPAGTGTEPYFDGRAECWVWGTYARSWSGMERTALEKMRAVETAGLAPDAYGADLPRMAREEQKRNIWAVRWLYHHLESGGLCLRPPWSMVEHIGFDERASNAGLADRWANPPLQLAPPIPEKWPEAVEQAECRGLWQRACPTEGVIMRQWRRGVGLARRLFRQGRSVLRVLVPLVLRRRLRGLWSWRWFRGDYPNWAAAQAASGGYADSMILSGILSATLAVRSGAAAFERDGVLFQEDDPDRPLLGALQEVRRRTGEHSLRVLDFGGSLGSTYWRHRTHLPNDSGLRWDVVEQPGFVAAGRLHLGDTPLRFYANVCEAEREARHDVLLCSCVLQYLDEPFRFLEEWSRLPIPCLLLNNLPLHEKGRDRLRVQHVPPSIYPASYPVWFFNRRAFLERVSVHYEIVREFNSEAQWPVGWGLFQSTGLLLQRRTSA